MNAIAPPRPVASTIRPVPAALCGNAPATAGLRSSSNVDLDEETSR
jgi:hypothetical protein